MALNFRFAGPSDVGAIVELVESAYRGEASRAGWTTEADLLDGQRTDTEGVLAGLATAGSWVLLAEEEAKLVGCCLLERQSDNEAYFGMFSVRPHEQGKGIGKAILREAEQLARDKWGCKKMVMSVIAQRQDLIAWYERRGYSRTGRTEPFPYGDERFGIPKRTDLHFVVLAKQLST